MREEKKAYEKTVVNSDLIKIGFKLPKSLYQALHYRMQEEGYTDGVGNYYFYLVSYEFYEQYKTIFYQVKEGIAPTPNSMEMRELPNFGISNEAAWELMSQKMVEKPVMIYKMPLTHIRACRHLASQLHYHKSDSLLYRFFTIKILISKLQKELKHIAAFP